MVRKIISFLIKFYCNISDTKTVSNSVLVWIRTIKFLVGATEKFTSNPIFSFAQPKDQFAREYRSIRPNMWYYRRHFRVRTARGYWNISFNFLFSSVCTIGMSAMGNRDRSYAERSNSRANGREIVQDSARPVLSVNPIVPRPCAFDCVHRDAGTSEPAAESLELWLRPLLGTNEAKRVDTEPSRAERSQPGRQAGLSSRFSRVILDCRELRVRSFGVSFTEPASLPPWLPIDSFKARLSWLRRRLSRYPGREFLGALHVFSYVSIR